MDESSERDRGSRPEGDDAGDRVGLGRVVEDHRPAAGSGAARRERPENEVEEASEDSFPASDPPPFTSSTDG
jgi:hypothetical protein